jgi:hypothetical protein
LRRYGNQQLARISQMTPISVIARARWQEHTKFSRAAKLGRSVLRPYNDMGRPEFCWISRHGRSVRPDVAREPGVPRMGRIGVYPIFFVTVANKGLRGYVKWKSAQAIDSKAVIPRH